MKKFFITALALTGLLIIGCEKDGQTPEPTGATGTWKYIGYAGGFAGLPFVPADTVEMYVQIDTTNNTILVNTKGEQHCSTYTFEKNNFGGGLLTIKDSLMFTNRFDINLMHDTLLLYPHDYMDAFESYFVPSSKHFDWCGNAGLVH